MPRAHRFRVPGCIWHITHRCHKREFMLKFSRDRKRWRYWLFQAKKRFGLRVLNYIVTSNHIHLLVKDQDRGEIAPAMQLVAGRVGQEYNLRKNRNGAFWEDRYHATAVDDDDHLIRCLAYIDLNMVRAGAVMHPAEWDVSGYREIQSAPQRYAVIDREELGALLGLADSGALAQAQQRWVNEALTTQNQERDPAWTESIAIGREAFVQAIRSQLGSRARYRTLSKVGADYCLREATEHYD